MKIGIVVGSVRQGRAGISVAQWVLEHAEGREGATYELVDLAAFDLPVLTSPVVPASAHRAYDDERVTRWSQAIDACDGFVFVTPEYNHGIPGAFKNAYDSIYPEWVDKAVAFVSYGAASGFRVVEAWRPVVANANMFGIRAQVAFSTMTDFDGAQVQPQERHLAELHTLFGKLEKATAALTTMRG